MGSCVRLHHSAAGTHGLTAVYHIAKGARPANLVEFIDPALLPDGPVQVAALVGDAIEPVAGTVTNGTAPSPCGARWRPRWARKRMTSSP